MVKNMSQKLDKQDMNRLRNAIHNEAGVTKEEIRQMVQDAVEHLVDKRVKQLLPDKLSMDNLVDQAIKDRSLYWYNKEKYLDERIISKVSQLLMNKIKVSLEVKK